MTTVTREEKARENRLRLMAHRQKLDLRRNKRRDPLAADYGEYYLLNQRTGLTMTVRGATRAESLDKIEALLLQGEG